MDTAALTSLVIEKLKDANLYSELDDKALFKSIHAGIRRSYEKHLYDAQKRLKAEENAGAEPDRQKYEQAYSEIEDRVMEYASKIAAVTKKEI